MVNEGDKDEKEKGFVIKDRRFSAKTDSDEPSQPKENKEETPPMEEPSKQEAPLPEINFPSLVLSLSTSAFIQMGEINDPVSNQPAKNLPQAKQTIDLIAMLKEKTKGNLTSEEEKFMENVLYDLKMRYVKAVS